LNELENQQKLKSKKSKNITNQNINPINPNVNVPPNPITTVDKIHPFSNYVKNKWQKLKFLFAVPLEARKMKFSLRSKFGVSLIASSFVLQGGLVFVPFIDVSMSTKSIITAFLLGGDEVTFFLGVYLTKDEMLVRFPNLAKYLEKATKKIPVVGTYIHKLIFPQVEEIAAPQFSLIYNPQIMTQRIDDIALTNRR